MNAAADADGGGAGPASFVLDRATLTAVAAGLGTAAETLDQVGTSRPTAGDTGLAQPLLLTILATASEAAARLAFESTTLAAAVEDCNVEAATVDSHVAAGFLLGGGGR